MIVPLVNHFSVHPCVDWDTCHSVDCSSVACHHPFSDVFSWSSLSESQMLLRMFLNLKQYSRAHGVKIECDEGSRVLRNVDIFLSDYATSHSVIQ
jgi:hypothetical protein